MPGGAYMNTDNSFIWPTVDTMDCSVKYSIQPPFPELYKDDLVAIVQVFDRLDDIGIIPGLEEVEISVRFFEDSSWIVIGYGETGEPCVLRIES
jgi:hypothetical protein